MKYIKIILLFISLGSLSSCYFFKAMKYKKYPLEKLDEFPTVKFQRSETPFKFFQGSIQKSVKEELDSMLLGSNRYAFLVIRNDSIIYEFYNHKITDTSLIHSFSVAKSYVSTMVAMAKEEGKIKSLNEPITNYLPELLDRDVRFKNITIQHVLDMRSGIKSSENYYNPFSDVLRLGFGKNVNGKALRISIEKEPNQKFEYKSVNTQLLGMIVERATKVKLQDYYYEKLHKPLQLEHDATWIYDDEKHKSLRAFCCMNLTARDYAKFGRLFLNKGNWQGKQLVSKEWVETNLNLENRKATDGYKNQWWSNVSFKKFKDSIAMQKFVLNNPAIVSVKRMFTLNYSGRQPLKEVDTENKFWGVTYYKDGIHAQGLIGQYIYISPLKNTIIVILSNTLNPDLPLKNGGLESIEKLLESEL
ncbi:MAG: serine hydrolase domain-containing protein [Chitinophagales bacterium]|jgi:CubicO group peptidase (beta-lactamase class C family)|nr:beta-lactamase family protein [Sphingobacteriales bacterium]